jgi:hypothetical protein
MQKRRNSRMRRRRPLNRSYRDLERWNTWTTGLVVGAIGLVAVSALWYRRKPPQAPSFDRLGWSRHGQAPSRSHIQMDSHPARQA